MLSIRGEGTVVGWPSSPSGSLSWLWVYVCLYPGIKKHAVLAHPCDTMWRGMPWSLSQARISWPPLWLTVARRRNLVMRFSVNLRKSGRQHVSRNFTSQKPCGEARYFSSRHRLVHVDSGGSQLAAATYLPISFLSFWFFHQDKTTVRRCFQWLSNRIMQHINISIQNSRHIHQ